MTILLVSWMEVGTLFLGGAGFTGIIMYILKWIRFRRNDSATKGKTDAESEKIKAEAYEVKSRADVTVADAALKLAQRLSEECDMTKKQLDKTQDDLENAMNSLRDATIKLSEVQHELTLEREKNKTMNLEINSLKEELNRLKNG